VGLVVHAIFAGPGQGGPPAAAPITSAASRKYAGPIIAGDITASCFASAPPRLSNRCTAVLRQNQSPGIDSVKTVRTLAEIRSCASPKRG
jgi:hypothetical protein